MRLPSALALCVWTAACGADLGALGGWEARTGHFVGAARLQASTKLGTPFNQDGFMVGATLETRGEQAFGSRWESGFLLGYGWSPAAIDGRVGFELYGEFGTPLQSTLFPHGELYTGAAASLPLYLGSARHVTDLNESTWILVRRFELVPLLRVRFHRLRESPAWRSDIAAGLSVRFRLLSDLF
ncbi:MAG TPA: hypothetical protein VJR89_07970 [Polyangiales bacterium]|nr:hypothetical protein [Polyangiales bacterium]